MEHSLTFWAIAVFAVLVTGISKGGFAGIGLLAVPIMSLVISPIKAAAIMLPILIVMDITSVWSYRNAWDKRILWMIVPGAIVGIAAGGLLAGYVNEQLVRFFVGLIAIAFPVYALMNSKNKSSFAKDSKPLGIFAGAVAGFTSFVAHAGAPPYQAFALQQGMEKRTFVSTSVMFFFIVNMIKLIPYAMLGQFDTSNISTSLMLIPLAPIGVMLGVWLVTKIDSTIFFKIIYSTIFIVGLTLVYDAI